ncbi:MAG: hypothetical protein AAF500_07440 [Myxococcota bacterium]
MNMVSVRHRSLATREVLALTIALLLGACGDTGGGAGSVSANAACEAWCTDPSCVSIHFTDDFPTCMNGCLNDQASPSCLNPYGSYIACLAASGCLSQCTSTLIAWAACEDGVDDEPVAEQSLTQICELGCTEATCPAAFIPGDRCVLNCVSGGRSGCEEQYRRWLQCKVTDCQAPCRDEGLALSNCSL